MKKEPLISIIVPIYNVEKYLDWCVQSILSQTYHNLEIFLIDDGSSDACGVMCDEYAQKDLRIKVIHQENQGVSVARNTGIKNAHGKYITFIDSDDYINKRYIEILYQNITLQNADISICHQTFVYENQELVEEDISEQIDVYSNLEALELMLYQTKINNSSWGKLFKKNLFSDITFPIGKIYEDVGTVYKLFLKSKKIVVSNLPYYYYFQRASSISKNFSKKTFDMLEMVYKMQEDLLEEVPVLKKAVDSRVLNAEFFVLRQHPKKEFKEEYQTLRNNIKKHRRSVLLNSHVRMKTKLGILVSYINFGFVPIFYNLLGNSYYLKKLD